MMKDVDTDLSEIFRTMNKSRDPAPADNPPAPKIKRVVLKGGRQKRTILPTVVLLAVLSIALLYLMLSHL